MEAPRPAPEELRVDEYEHEEGNDVDDELLSELFVLLDDGTPDGLIQACDLFLVGVPTALADVRSALAERRLAEVRRVAHTLRGTAGAFGAIRLGRLATRLEERCGPDATSADVAAAGIVIDQMEADFVAFRAILMARLVAPTPG